MTEAWQRRRILVWGKTRPEVSQKYRETVCTGGVFEDTKALVRLYPIPLRYMDDVSTFKKYQWIEADVQRAADHDPRPESYRIRVGDIVLGDQIGTERGTWSTRKTWIMQRGNLFESVEHLRASQREHHTSLGLVQPARIVGVSAQRWPAAERAVYLDRYRAIVAQLEMEFDDAALRAPRPLTPPDYRFLVKFQCQNRACHGHECSVLDWEVDALYFRQRAAGRAPHVAARDVVEKLEQYCADDKDTRFFMGNISTHPQNFTIVGLWHPKKLVPTRDRSANRLF